MKEFVKIGLEKYTRMIQYQESLKRESVHLREKKKELYKYVFERAYDDNEYYLSRIEKWDDSDTNYRIYKGHMNDLGLSSEVTADLMNDIRSFMYLKKNPDVKDEIEEEKGE